MCRIYKDNRRYGPTYAYGRICNMNKLISFFLLVFVFTAAPADDLQIAPDGTWVGGGDPQIAPDGTWVGGDPRIAPDGSWVGGHDPEIAPDGTWR